MCGEGAYENNGEWDYIRKPEIINEDGCRPSCDNMASKGNAEIWCHNKVEIYYTQQKHTKSAKNSHRKEIIFLNSM